MKLATLTVKNQITLPVDIVRQFRLGPSRQFSVEKRGDEIVLKPEAEAMERIEAMWERNKKLIKRSLSDKELRLARMEAIEEHVETRLEQWRKQGI